MSLKYLEISICLPLLPNLTEHIVFYINNDCSEKVEIFRGFVVYKYGMKGISRNFISGKT